MWILPISIFKFWYFQAPVSLISYFVNLNKYLLNLLSFSLMFKTFLRPWKNEYRQGLVNFSIFMGIVFKTLLIIADILIFLVIIPVEIAIFVIFLLLPIAAFVLPFIKV